MAEKPRDSGKPNPSSNRPLMTSDSYRPEIDGLRTIAVLGVVLFHLDFGFFPGGFAGVDVFFVISGYLISRRIIGDLQNGSFSFAGFYARRARRILPALIFTVGVSFIAGLLWLSPIAMRQLAKESTHALLSISNIQYWRESQQYFSTSSDQLALLHCWSLSLEEQFYLLWPIILMIALYVRKLPLTIVGLGILSFGLAVWWARFDPQAAFFLTPFRVFEFAIGTSITFAERDVRQNKTLAHGLTTFGLLCIIGSFVLFTPTSPFGVVTLIPCIGAAAIILASSKGGANYLLTSRPVLAVGRASYSLYLCHWPMIFFAGVIFGDAAKAPGGKIALLIAMLATAFLMQRFVETPFRHMRANARTLARFAAATLVVAVATHGTFLAEGWPQRLTAEQRARTKLLEFSFQPCQPIEGNRCAFGNPNAPLGVELIGDSLAEQYVGAFDPILREKNIRGEISRYASGCPVLMGLDLPRNNWNPRLCQQTMTEELARVRQTTTHLVIAQHWAAYSDDQYEKGRAASSERYSRTQRALEATIRELGKNGRKILLMGAMVSAQQCNFDPARLLPGPLPHANPPDCAPKPKSVAIKETAEINAMLSAVQQKWPAQVSLLLPTDVFCDEQCPTVKDGAWLYVNANHFNVSGARYFGERAKDQFNRFLD